ncbi:response regulator [Rheinheimera sp. UJ51]|uniref:response regulator n=1 Tax=unclassified Rheinheimera TaxID=115860 RepID=UPI001E2BCD48|nr:MULTISPECIES: response regulator [unclassified Rheinheimera]MCC5450595.1 response regulator [Rheinheimera sp. UJ51]MCF4008747.1 response regulator [Rheinheimera sp. UJ63]
MSKTILIVEDESKLAALLNDYLQQSGFSTHIIGDGALVVAWIQTHQPAAVLLDIMLPHKDGIDICKEVRQFSNVPILMLTARVEEIDRLIGLELGADDYMCKPFSPREVVARVKAVLRRVTPPETTLPSTVASPALAAKPVIELLPKQFCILINGQRCALTAVEFQLLHTMAAHPHQVFSRSQLMDAIYADYRIVNERTIDSHIKKLRKKLDVALPHTTLVESVYGVGYKYVFQ